MTPFSPNEYSLPACFDFEYLTGLFFSSSSSGSLDFYLVAPKGFGVRIFKKKNLQDIYGIAF